MRRADVVQTLSDLVGFARALATRVGAQKSTELRVQTSDDDAGQKWSELWGHAPLLYRPCADTECLFVELGDEQVVLATKDRRWQVEVKEGEVVVRAVGSGAAYVRLTPSGACEVFASDIKLGANATKKVALDELVRDAIETAITGHTHGGVTAGSATTGNGVLAGTVVSTAAERVKAE